MLERWCARSIVTDGVREPDWCAEGIDRDPLDVPAGRTVTSRDDGVPSAEPRFRELVSGEATLAAARVACC